MLNLKLQREPQQSSLIPGELLDVVIVGGGPAGLAAGLYAARAGLNTLLLEKAAVVGGQAASTALVENCPGCIEGSGAEIAQHMLDRAVKFGMKLVTADVTAVDLLAVPKMVDTSAGQARAKTIIIATGAQPSRIGARGEVEFTGRGVMYCATCDGPFYKDKHIAVIGGGDSAVQEGNYLTRFASKVTIIHRRDSFRASKVLQDRVFANPKIEILWNTTVTDIKGGEHVETLVLQNTQNKESFEFPIDGVFVYVGLKPNTEMFKGILEMDERGYIITNDRMETNVPGVFAAGDVRRKSLRQVVTATADGATAAISADEFLNH